MNKFENLLELKFNSEFYKMEKINIEEGLENYTYNMYCLIKKIFLLF